MTLDVKAMFIPWVQTTTNVLKCDRMAWHIMCLQHDIPVWQRYKRSSTISRYSRDMVLDVESGIKPNDFLSAVQKMKFLSQIQSICA